MPTFKRNFLQSWTCGTRNGPCSAVIVVILSGSVSVTEPIYVIFMKGDYPHYWVEVDPEDASDGAVINSLLYSYTIP